jgi:hypothetical protein
VPEIKCMSILDLVHMNSHFPQTVESVCCSTLLQLLHRICWIWRETVAFIVLFSKRRIFSFHNHFKHLRRLYFRNYNFPLSIVRKLLTDDRLIQSITVLNNVMSYGSWSPFLILQSHALTLSLIDAQESDM